ncbi:hypothetical protein BC941DRAFT_455229 [Chlamydoabsidia padenii]|nr:hypothetical protein BC941DRAFT_455229 [Chlamydoabsidia padenii]
MHRSNSYQATTEPISPAPSPAHLYSQQQWTRTWIETTLKQPLPTTNLFLCLRTGVILCRLINILHPGIISKIYYDECISAKEQNIRQFLDAGSKLGLQDCELFKVDHLLEGKDMNAVLWTLSRLATLTGTQQQQQVSWSSYDLYSIGSSMLSTPLTPLADDNKTTSSTYEHATYHQGSHIGSNIPTEKGLDQLKEANSYHSGDLSLLLSIQQRRGSNDLQQHRTSLWSLPDEEDDIDWNHHHRPQSPRTQSFGPSSLPTTPQSTFKSIKIPSTDSGYGTAQQPTPPQSTTVPLKLVSLFDQSQQHCPITPSSTSYQTYNGSGTDDDDDDMNLQTTCDTSPSSNDSNKNGKGSISSRLSSLSSFGKKFSLRQKTPFHMRYQEWTESHMNNNSNTKPSVINLFDLPNLDTSSSLVHPSVSSPLLSKSHQQFTITDKHHSSDNNNNNRANLTIQESTSSTEPLPTDIINSSSLGETLTRRKSTSNLEGQKRSTITRTSSEIVCQQDSLELIGVDGQVTAKYKLGNVIGKGQFGIVYRALELRTGKMMAVKRIKLDSSKEGDLLDVMQEAKLLQQLSHPNIVKYEGIIQTQDHVNIILEYVENGSLLNTLKSFGSFPENLVASYCTRVLHGLQYLHGQNVAHCDLKAANLLTTKSGLVKLSDFGVSLNLGLKETEVGAVAGTPNWMAPEVIKLKGASTKSDIWSLGCTIIELCTGKPPYSDMLPMTALFRIVEDDFPPLPDGLSEELCEFLKDCFAKNPDDRPTAEELLSHAWIRTYQHEEPDMEQLDNITGEQHDLNDSINLPTQSDHTISLSLSNTPLESTHDLPSDIDTTGRPASSSVLANKFQQQQQEHYDYIRQHHSTQVVIPHCYVKGTFPKGAVKCKSCHLPIKKDAFICEGKYERIGHK